MQEIIKTIEGTNNRYTVSNLGIIRVDGEILPYRIEETGYCTTKIELLIGTRWFNIHRIVATYFCTGRTTEKNQVNHIDGNKKNNQASNLEWVTNTENQRHRVDVLGKDCKGSHNPMYGIKGIQSPVFKGYIKQIDPNTNTIIATYAGSGDASRNTGWAACNILRALNKDKLYHGYKWIR